MIATSEMEVVVEGQHRHSSSQREEEGKQNFCVIEAGPIPSSYYVHKSSRNNGFCSDETGIILFRPLTLVSITTPLMSGEQFNTGR